MKITPFSMILAGSLFFGFSASYAETPVKSCPNDSDAVEGTAVEIPFSIVKRNDIPINEHEIRAGLLYDVINKKVVWEKNISTPYPIASLTKMMVALLTVEDVRAGKYAWEDEVKWTRTTIVGRKKNRRKVYTSVNYSLRDVFKATMIASNNECAEQMARYIGGGDLQLTIDRMNARAKELGMMQTYYGNPTGLPAPHRMFDNSSTPSDLLMLTIEMLQYNEVLEIASMGYAEIENGKSKNVIRNHNTLTIDFSGEVDGLKTGYTKRAGFCLVATTAKCDHRLVSIVLGCRAPQIRNEIVRDMVNDYYTVIGLDRLGPYSPSLIKTENNLTADAGVNGRYVTIMEPVKRMHVVRSGENLSVIAERYKCTTGQLRRWNDMSPNSSRIYAGQKLIVVSERPKNIFIKDPINGNETDEDKPLITEEEKKDLDKAADQADASDEAAIVETPKAPPQNYFYHTVEPGDTLFNIARRYDGVSVEELKILNKISDSNMLKPGTKIKIKVHG